MKLLAKAAALVGLAAASQFAAANYTITGTVSSDFQITSSTLVLLMDGCYHFNYGTPNPSAFSAGVTSSFWSEIDSGVSTPDDINDKKYAFFATYLRQDGSTGVAVSMNSFVAGSIVGSKTYDDVFNSDGYGISESDLVQAISDAASDNWDIYQPARYKITDSFGRLMSYWVSNGTEDISAVSKLDQTSTLVCFSTASNGGQISATAAQAVPGPGAGISLAIGLASIWRKRRR